MNLIGKFQLAFFLFLTAGILLSWMYPDSAFSNVISVLGFLLIGPFIYLSLKQDGKQEGWLKLVEKYRAKRGLNPDFKYTEQRVFFRTTSDEKFSNHNRMMVRETQDDIEIQPTINTFFVEPILIPKLDIEFVEKETMFFWVRRIYRIKGSSNEIALM